MGGAGRGGPVTASLRSIGAAVLIATVLGCGTVPASPGAATAGPTPPPAATSTVAPTQAPSPTAAPEPTLVPDLAGKFSVGDHALYLECYGTTGPVLVFEAGSGGAMLVWKRGVEFLGLVDTEYRRCLYDRANAGLSDRDSDPRTSVTSAEELHDLLEAADLPGPYVLIARSFGGYVARPFAAMYPEDVRGMVLIETLTPEFHRGLEQLLTREQWASEVLGVQSLERPLDVLASTDLVADAKLPDVPLLVVAGTKWHSGNEPWPPGWPAQQLDALWDEAQQTLADSVPRGELVVFEGGDHSLHISEPRRLADELNAFLAEL